MAKKKKIKSTKAKVEGNKQVATGEPEKNLDFGGLPQRDLKKNLGCG
jgi:hypothetical protein